MSQEFWFWSDECGLDLQVSLISIVIRVNAIKDASAFQWNIHQLPKHTPDSYVRETTPQHCTCWSYSYSFIYWNMTSTSRTLSVCVYVMSVSVAPSNVFITGMERQLDVFKKYKILQYCLVLVSESTEVAKSDEHLDLQYLLLLSTQAIKFISFFISLLFWLQQSVFWLLTR